MTYHNMGAKHTVWDKWWALFPHFCGSLWDYVDAIL